MKISPHIHTHTHLQAHIHTTHTDTDVTTRQAYRSHTEQTHVYTDTNTPQTYAHVATCTHTHTHINIRYTHMVLYTITCLPKISERDSAEYSIISLLFLHCIHWKKFARKIGTWYFQTLHLYWILNKSHGTTNNKSWRGCGEKGALWYCWWECKLVQPLWRTLWRFLKKLKIKFPYDPAVPLLGIYLDKTIIQKQIHAPQYSFQHYLQ